MAAEILEILASTPGSFGRRVIIRAGSVPTLETASTAAHKPSPAAADCLLETQIRAQIWKLFIHCHKHSHCVGRIEKITLESHNAEDLDIFVVITVNKFTALSRKSLALGSAS